MLLLYLGKDIKGILRDIEKEQGIKILFAVEAGSRAVGINNIYSDYDIRFVYTRKTKDYLRLSELPDTVSVNKDDLDICGWDLKKFLNLLYRSNMSVFEWLCSNITYIWSEDVNTLRTMSSGYFSVKVGLLHYGNLAKKNYSKLNKGEVIAKDCDRVIESVLRAKYISAYKEFPSSMWYDCLLYDSEIDVPTDVYLSIKSITDLRVKNKDARIDLPENLKSYITESIDTILKTVDSLIRENKSISIEPLNEFFLSVLNKDL